MLSIEKIVKTIDQILGWARLAPVTIPAILLICDQIKRPGLSAVVTAANIIRRQTEAGAPYGPAADGSQNVAEAMELIRVQEIFRALRLEGKIDTAFPIGAIQFMGAGANAGGPIQITGMNINMPQGFSKQS